VSITTSPNDGCGWIVNAISSAFIPDSTANDNSEIISEAPTPATCAPTITLSSTVVTKRTNPSVLPKEIARPLPDNGNLYDLAFKPASFASAIVIPTVANSGSVKATAGIAL